MPEFALVLAGSVVGLIVGLTGVGGGSLMTPLLIFGFGVTPHVAVGTDLLFAATTKFSGTVHHARQGNVPWKIVGALCLGSVPAAFATLYGLHVLGHASRAAASLMTTTLGFALILTALASAIRIWRQVSVPVPGPGMQNVTGADYSLLPRHRAWPIVAGAALGVVVTLTSVGAGAIGVMALMLMYPHLPMPRVVGADIAYAVPLTLVSGLGHAWLGSVDWALLGWLLCGSLPGIWAGARLAQRVPEKLCRGLLCLLMTFAGVKLLAP